MDVVTVDLDDTLIHTSRDYTEASERFQSFISHEYGIDPDRAENTRKEIDRGNLAEMGASLERFPTSFQDALKLLVENPTHEHLERMAEIGQTAFRTTEEYRRRGFMEGSEELLTELNSLGKELHLLTAGVPELQQRKINALNLNERLDDIHIVGLDEKAEVLDRLLTETQAPPSRVLHVGNSERSDVHAALDAGTQALYIPQGQWLGTSGEEYDSHPDVHVFRSRHTAARSIQSGVFS